jgi:hypothetical protein
MAYLLAPLDAMIDTPGVQYVWGGVQFATAADYAGVVAALDAAVLRVEALHEALPIARNHLGRPRVCLLSMGSNRWHAATVGRITPKRVVLTTPDDDVTLKREKGYPAVAGTAFDAERAAGDLWSNSTAAICLRWVGDNASKPRLRVNRIDRQPDGSYVSRFEPEDWRLGKFLQRHGAKVRATWAVALDHHGQDVWPSHTTTKGSD